MLKLFSFSLVELEFQRKTIFARVLTKNYALLRNLKIRIKNFRTNSEWFEINQDDSKNFFRFPLTYDYGRPCPNRPPPVPSRDTVFSLCPRTDSQCSPDWLSFSSDSGIRIGRLNQSRKYFRSVLRFFRKKKESFL